MKSAITQYSHGQYTQMLNLQAIGKNLEACQQYAKEPQETNKNRTPVKIAANNLPKLAVETYHLEKSIKQAMDKIIEYACEHGMEFDTESLVENSLDRNKKLSSYPIGEKVIVIIPGTTDDTDYSILYKRATNIYARDMHAARNIEHLLSHLIRQVGLKRIVDTLIQKHEDLLSRCLPPGDFVPYPSPPSGISRGIRVLSQERESHI